MPIIFLRFLFLLSILLKYCTEYLNSKTHFPQALNRYIFINYFLNVIQKVYYKIDFQICRKFIYFKWKNWLTRKIRSETGFLFCFLNFRMFLDFYFRQNNLLGISLKSCKKKFLANFIILAKSIGKLFKIIYICVGTKRKKTTMCKNVCTVI